MAVHAASDLVVRWITGEPGMAATRIAFSRQVADRDGEVTKELYLVDSDGENLRRISNFGSISLSPAWSPDGTRILYNSFKSGLPAIYEMDLATRSERVLEVNRGGQFMTPTYHPNGRDVVFSILDGRRSGLFSYDFSRDCCLAHLSGGRWNDQSPSFSPDGSRIAFESNRLGDPIPQIYVMDSNGGEADLISPYAYGRGGYYTSPDWSPTSDRIAFHGRIRRGRYQILVADVADRGRRVIQLTAEGNNEDPSWAPDGRHIVFVGEREWGFGIFVVDAVTGRLRLLVGGIRGSVPEWSPTLREAPSGGLPAAGR
jgi:TolB protein